MVEQHPSQSHSHVVFSNEGTEANTLRKLSSGRHPAGTVLLMKQLVV